LFKSRSLLLEAKKRVDSKSLAAHLIRMEGTPLKKDGTLLFLVSNFFIFFKN